MTRVINSGFEENHNRDYDILAPFMCMLTNSIFLTCKDIQQKDYEKVHEEKKINSCHATKKFT